MEPRNDCEGRDCGTWEECPDRINPCVPQESDVVLLVPDDTEEDWGFAEKDAKVIPVPRERWKEIVAFLDHPETGVRMSRPKRKEGNDCAD